MQLIEGRVCVCVCVCVFVCAHACVRVCVYIFYKKKTDT